MTPEPTGQPLPDGSVRYVLSAPTLSCGKCVGAVERALAAMPGVAAARANLTLKRVDLTLAGPTVSARQVIAALDRAGYPTSPIDEQDLTTDREATRLLLALAVAGFAAANIMLLSVSVWSGADGATRDLFHLISALIAIPAVAYAGQVFFRSALAALRAGRLNMDVPISLAVLLALGMSVFETLNGGTDAFFDAAVTLLFFLLIGRYLDRRMREKARGAVAGLSRLAAKTAIRVAAPGTGDDLATIPIGDIRPGMVLRVFPGDRVPVDGVVVKGAADIDRALVTGESAPVAATVGDTIEAGTLNLNAAIDIRALRPANASFLAEVTQMLAAAETGRGTYVRIADRMARIYAPAVHLLALAAFAGWLTATGDWRASLYVAISVLIVTCPCALGLAVPVVHVIAAGRLFDAGIMLKDGAALERLAEADRAVFDKTGTLTTGTPTVASTTLAGTRQAAMAKVLASHSSHPASHAVRDYLAHAPAFPMGDIQVAGVRELPGLGVEATIGGARARLGKPDWVAAIATPGPRPAGVAFAVAGGPASQFTMAEHLRPGARQAIAALAAAGIPGEILSGDHAAAIAEVAAQVGITDYRASQSPAAKVARIRDLHAAGHRTLVVGDGLNDAPALAAGHVSMAPASASDIGRRAADIVFTRDDLSAVPFAHAIARRAATIVRQNFALALAYNCVAVPLAVAGLVTPLVAALAMSASSIVVVANSLRLARRASARDHRAAPARHQAVGAPA